MLGFLTGAARALGVKVTLHKSRKGPTPSGLTPSEESDLGFDNTPSGLTTQTGGGGGNLPALVGPTLGAITTGFQTVRRAKCPHGYTFVSKGPPGILGTPSGVCVLTKVARALGLAHRKRGRGISSRDLRAALRVNRLVHRLAPKMGIHRGRTGHGSGCACKRCK
jgi:hypothetical protein